MARSSSRKRGNPKDNKRRGKKKISLLSSEKIEYVDYKDVDLLRRFLSDRAKIRGRRVNGNDVQQQRVVSKAIKNAREMGLLPYTSRVTTQRRGRSDRGDSPRRSRDENAPFEETESPAPVASDAETAVVDSDATVSEGAET